MIIDAREVKHIYLSTQYTYMRQKESLPIINEFFELIHSLEKLSLPQSHFGKAVTYSSNQETKSKTYLDDGRIEISNNITERIIRPFCIGRNNWLFMNTVRGANQVRIFIV